MRTLPLVVALSFLFAGCGCGTPPTAGDASDQPNGEGGPDGCTGLPAGAACVMNADCCSNFCQAGTCQALVCADLGAACAASGDCCSGRCSATGTGPDGGVVTTCTRGGCLDNGQSCGLDSQCCSLSCAGGTCGAGAACASIGEACAADGDCCSMSCDTATSVCGSFWTNPCLAIGEACTAAGGNCCSGLCANGLGAACTAADSSCRCGLATGCRPSYELCTQGGDCCNDYCERMAAGDPAGRCASLNPPGCATVGEPCGTSGVNASCCSRACADPRETSVPTCQFLGGCRPIGEVCAGAADCCSGRCEVAQTLADGQQVLRCTGVGDPCLEAGEVCFTGASNNCCPAGPNPASRCLTAIAGVNRCFGDTTGCTAAGQSCATTAECCMTEGAFMCQANASGSNVCCLGAGASCATPDECCGLVCAPDATGALACGSGCRAGGEACTSDADCCDCFCNPDGTCCRTAGQACALATDCCSGSCTSGLCDPPPSSLCCTPLGGACTMDSDCCNPTAVYCTTAEFPSCALRP